MPNIQHSTLTLTDLENALASLPKIPEIELRHGTKAGALVRQWLGSVLKEESPRTLLPFAGIPLVADQRMPEHIAMLVEDKKPKVLLNLNTGQMYEFGDDWFPCP